jgi:hypothetical protein
MEEVSIVFVVYKPATMVFVTFAFNGLQILQTRFVVTLALGSWPRQGLRRVQAKKGSRKSHLMLLGVQKSVREWTFILPSELPLCTTRNLPFCYCLMQLVFICMRHLQLQIRPIAWDKLQQNCCCIRQSVYTVGLYGFIHPYSTITIVSATTCNYRGCVPIALHVN